MVEIPKGRRATECFVRLARSDTLTVFGGLDGRRLKKFTSIGNRRIGQVSLSKTPFVLDLITNIIVHTMKCNLAIERMLRLIFYSSELCVRRLTKFDRLKQIKLVDT